MEFKAGDKVYLWKFLRDSGEFHAGVIFAGKPSLHHPRRWAVRYSRNVANVESEDDLALVSDLTELERLYYGV